MTETELNEIEARLNGAAWVSADVARKLIEEIRRLHVEIVDVLEVNNTSYFLEREARDKDEWESKISGFDWPDDEADK